MPEMALPTAHASLLPTHFVLGVYPDYTSGRLSLLHFPTQQQHPPCGEQATHANAKTKACPKSVAAPNLR
jgi:hypothetical protein